MGKRLLLLLILTGASVYSQEKSCAIAKRRSAAMLFGQASAKSAVTSLVNHEHKYDVKFVHLDLQLERTNKNIAGNVKTVATVTVAALDTFMTILHTNHTIDSMRFNGVLVTPLRQDSMVKVTPPSPLVVGNTFTTVIYYHGTAPTGGAAIGSGFSNATSPSWGNQATWSLSESFVAYHWWPCKQVLTDKIDSSWVFVTTDSTNKVGSNGVLTNVVTIGAKKRYEWKSHYPIDYYLVSVAIAKYKEYRQYAKPQYLVNDSILILNYIYDNAINNPSWIANQKPDLDKMPATIKFLSNMYGMYPFRKEKYGHSMAPLSGGMEHQTMTTLGFFEFYIDAHELGHQWWGDQVTCKSWGDIWINEGFASYTEHLVAEYLDPVNFAPNLLSAHNSVMTAAGGSVRVPAQDTMNSNRIFSSRLTYDKGGAIIHTLRFVTNNDSVWFNCLRGFQNQFKNSTASANDFFSFYHTFTGIDPTQFRQQWYDGEGYPTFNVKYNYSGTNLYLKTTETVSMPTVTPLFITPLEYRILRMGMPDTTIRMVHANAVESYTIPLTGTVTSVVCDPNNWVINKVVGPARDLSLGDANLEAISEFTSGGLAIGPNPVRAQLQVNNAAGLAGVITLSDARGAVLLSSRIETTNEIDMTALPPGAYIVSAKNSSGEILLVRKILKE